MTREWKKKQVCVVVFFFLYDMVLIVIFCFTLPSEMYKHREVKSGGSHFGMQCETCSANNSLFHRVYLKNLSDFILICNFRTVNSGISWALNG